MMLSLLPYIFDLFSEEVDIEQAFIKRMEGNYLILIALGREFEVANIRKSSKKDLIIMNATLLIQCLLLFEIVKFSFGYELEEHDTCKIREILNESRFKKKDLIKIIIRSFFVKFAQ